MINNKLNSFNLVRKSALWLSRQYLSAKSYYKVRESQLVSTSPLSAIERDFYLKYRVCLKGKELVVYDIGASKGTVVKCLAKLPNIISVQAFEPIPNVYTQLVGNTGQYSQIKCHNIALGDVNGSLPFNISKKSDSSSLLPMAKIHSDQLPGTEICDQMQVPVLKLDDYVDKYKLPTPQFIKIDVQGYEKNVLKGGKKTISKSDYCVLEMSFKPLYEGSPLFDDIYRLMYDLGFKIVGFTSPLIGKKGIQLQVDGIFKKRK